MYQRMLWHELFKILQGLKPTIRPRTNSSADKNKHRASDFHQTASKMVLTLGRKWIDQGGNQNEQ